MEEGVTEIVGQAPLMTAVPLSTRAISAHETLRSWSLAIITKASNTDPREEIEHERAARDSSFLHQRQKQQKLLRAFFRTPITQVITGDDQSRAAYARCSPSISKALVRQPPTPGSARAVRSSWRRSNTPAEVAPRTNMPSISSLVLEVRRGNASWRPGQARPRCQPRSNSCVKVTCKISRLNTTAIWYYLQQTRQK